MQFQNPNYVLYEKPLSYAPATPEDTKDTEILNEIMKKNNRIPDKEEYEHRKAVLGKLDRIVKNWVSSIAESFKIPQLDDDVKALILTSGSFRLGVYSPGSDIDTLCIVPEYVTKQQFFEGLADNLRKTKEVTKALPIKDAFVPVIKLEFDGIEMDLLFAQVKGQIVKKNFNVLDHKNLIGLDTPSQKSLNGPAVATEILNRVPNIENFRVTLRYIKFWAEKRAVVGNMVGFLTGVAWALLTAKICQFYPNAPPSVLLAKFFNFFAEWRWPRPIMLKPIDDFGIPGLDVWNPKTNQHDAKELMPVITPVYPSMCATHNVSETTKRIIQQEFQRGRAIIAEIQRRKQIQQQNENFAQIFDLKQENPVKTEENPAKPQKKDANLIDWETLFEENDFFVRYKDYLKIEIQTLTSPNPELTKTNTIPDFNSFTDAESMEELNSANPSEKHGFWVGFVESRLRHLFPILETMPNVLLHPHPKKFDNPKNEKLQEKEKNQEKTEENPENQEEIPENQENPEKENEEKSNCFSTYLFVGLEVKKQPKTPENQNQQKNAKNAQNQQKNVDLSSYIDKFMSVLRNDKKLKKTPEMMDPIIIPIKKKDIPDFVCPKEKQNILRKNRKKKIPGFDAVEEKETEKEKDKINPPQKRAATAIANSPDNLEPAKKKRMVQPQNNNKNVSNVNVNVAPGQQQSVLKKNGKTHDQSDDEEEEDNNVLGVAKSGLLSSKQKAAPINPVLMSTTTSVGASLRNQTQALQPGVIPFPPNSVAQ